MKNKFNGKLLFKESNTVLGKKLKNIEYYTYYNTAIVNQNISKLLEEIYKKSQTSKVGFKIIQTNVENDTEKVLIDVKGELLKKELSCGKLYGWYISYKKDKKDEYICIDDIMWNLIGETVNIVVDDIDYIKKIKIDKDEENYEDDSEDAK